MNVRRSGNFSGWLLALGLLVVLGLSQSAMAGEFKVGVVDFNRALDATEKDGALKKLQRDAEKRQSKLKDQEKAIVALEQEIQDSGPLLSQEKLREKMAAYQQMALEYRKTAITFEQEFAETRAKVLGEIQQKMAAISVSIAQDNKLDFMVERNEGAVLYFKNSFDYTDELIKRYEAQKKK